MATRLKKLFHHKRDDEDTPDSPTHEGNHHRRFSRSDHSKPSLRQSMDESGLAADSTSAMAGRQSETYSRGGAPQVGHLANASTPAGQDGQLSSDFSRLNIDSTPATRHQQDSYPPGQPAPGQAQYYRDLPGRRTAAIRRVEAEDSTLEPPGQRSDIDERRNNYSTTSAADPNDPAYGQHQLEQGLSRPASTFIPRKEVGSRTTPPGTSSSNSRQSTLQKPLPATPPGARGSSVSNFPGTSGPRHAASGAQMVGDTLTAEEVLSRARDNTADTTVIEKIAPAVVHETVNKEVHHVRQEVVTREVHNHEYYHRILPVIDVEVLPPRHFLPVEGGGLVEVNADEVPGRGKNWVIAETASQIPSNEPFPVKPTLFTAREFVGKEGDEKRYMTEEGYERTEQTWVHPPELETGARETGQTWPMEFEEREGDRMQSRSQTHGQHEALARSQGLGQTQTPSRFETESQMKNPSQTQTRSPIKDGKRKKGILKNATPRAEVDERIDVPGSYD